MAFNTMKNIDNKGVAIIVVVIISSAILGMGLGISSIILREIQISAPIDESVGAIMAADAGMERKLWEIRQTVGADPLTRYDKTYLPNGAFFIVCGQGQTAKCEYDDTSGQYTLSSQGEFRNTQRAWEATY